MYLIFYNSWILQINQYFNILTRITEMGEEKVLHRT